jgi:hypothetical protein
MSTTILLIRHGQTRSNVTGYYMGWSKEDLKQVTGGLLSVETDLGKAVDGILAHIEGNREKLGI